METSFDNDLGAWSIKRNQEIDLCIVIPCYNEEKGIDVTAYRGFLERTTGVILCFVNDGSSDETLTVIQRIAKGFDQKVDVLNIKRNVGKSEAVRCGILHCNITYRHRSVAFLDADLSTSLSECVTMSGHLNRKINFVFGSRIMKIGSVIKRKPFRFLIGRALATLISWMLNLKVYDTQCGCKIFTRDLSRILFQQRFISKWLFDVELFFRMILVNGRNPALARMLEIPLNQWTDKGQSKVPISYILGLWIDLLKIQVRYHRALKSHQAVQESGKTVVWGFDQITPEPTYDARTGTPKKLI